MALAGWLGVLATYLAARRTVGADAAWWASLFLATGLLYATDYRDIDGIIIPATRRGYAWQGDYQLIPEPLLVAIDMGEITIR